MFNISVYVGVKGSCLIRFLSGIMANFDMFDDDYGDLFITQQSRECNSVSLEEDGEVDPFKTVNDPKYSDISDYEDEDGACSKRFRSVCFIV